MMSLPWLLPKVDPSERLPDDTEWEMYDELALWKQCKLRGLEACVKKPGDALRTLNELKHVEVMWSCNCEAAQVGGVDLPKPLAEEKALAALVKHTKTQNMQVLDVKERQTGVVPGPEMVVEMPDAIVSLGWYKRCSCDFQFRISSCLVTCPHILYVEQFILKCPEHFQKKECIAPSMLQQYFANAPFALAPRCLERRQGPGHTLDNRECQLCFKEVDDNRDIVRCKACNRGAHQICHLICIARKAACEGGPCPLWCPECPWIRPREKAEPEVIPAAVMQEPPSSEGSSAAVVDGSLPAKKRKFDGFKQEEQV